MKYKITESQYRRVLGVTEGKNARHNGMGAEKPYYIDQLNATNRKEQQLENNVNQTIKEVEKAINFVNAYDINTNVNFPANGSIFKVVIGNDGRIRKDKAGRGTTYTGFKDSAEFFGAKMFGSEERKELHIYVRAPKGSDHKYDLPDPKAVRTATVSPYAEAYNKALAGHESTILDFLKYTVLGKDDYERDAKELAADRNDAKAQAKVDARNAELSKSEYTGSLGAKKTKGDIRHLLKTIELTGGPEFSGPILNKLKRAISNLSTIRNYHLPQEVLVGNDLPNHRKIANAKNKVHYLITVLEKKLKKDDINLPIGLAGLRNALADDLGKS
jgi:hypothetical protein